MKRHGLSLPVSKTTLYIGLAIMTAIMLSILVVNVWSTAEGAKETGITISMFRIAQTIALMQIQPTMHARMSFPRGFDRVKITATNMTIRANSLWVTGNPKFDYDRSDTIDFDEEIVSGEQSLLCIVNDGSLDISDCQGGAAFGHCSSGSCRSIADGYPREKAGYYCQSGVYTRRNYYVKRALSDGPRCGSSHSGEFLIGNYFSCPDQAEPNADVSCSVRITYNCTTSTASPPHSVMRLEWGSTTRTSEKTFNCAGETVSRKHRIIKEMPEGQDTITASVEITSSMGDYTPPEVTISAVSE